MRKSVHRVWPFAVAYSLVIVLLVNGHVNQWKRREQGRWEPFWRDHGRFPEDCWRVVGVVWRRRLGGLLCPCSLSSSTPAGEPGSIMLVVLIWNLRVERLVANCFQTLFGISPLNGGLRHKECRNPEPGSRVGVRAKLIQSNSYPGGILDALGRKWAGNNLLAGPLGYLPCPLAFAAIFLFTPILKGKSPFPMYLFLPT